MKKLTIEQTPSQDLTGKHADVQWGRNTPLAAAARGLIAAGQLLGTIIIWLVILMPLWVIMLGIIYLRRRQWKEGLSLNRIR